MIISFLTAISLNFDTFSVTIIEGSQKTKPTIKEALKVGLFFSIGQGFLALIGSLLGLGLKLLISNIDHWVAFILLAFIGGKFIKESVELKKDDKRNSLNFQTLFLLVIATSIDALVIGITFVFTKASITSNILMISLVTFIVSSSGFYGGKYFKNIFKENTKIIGGLILISLGLKILIEHLFLI